MTEPRDDLRSALVQAADGTDRLTDDELVAIVIIRGLRSLPLTLTT